MTFPTTTNTPKPLSPNTLRGLTDVQWRDLHLRSLQAPVVDGFQMPGVVSSNVQAQFVGSSDSTALEEGFDFYDFVKQQMQQRGRPLHTASRVLDFGVGWGRILRFFVREVEPGNLHGCDVDPAILQFCVENVGFGHYFPVAALPPSTIPADEYDLIYAYSVFSHLAEPVAGAWIEEFARILKPGGIVIATTQPRSFLHFVQSLRNENHHSEWHQALSTAFPNLRQAYRNYDQGRFVFNPTGGGEARPSTFYGDALVSKRYIRTHWTNNLQLRLFQSNPPNLHQAVFILQRPVDSTAYHTPVARTMRAWQRAASNRADAISSVISRGWIKLRDTVLQTLSSLTNR